MDDILNINSESILDSIKKLLSIMPEETVFDTEIIIFINTIFANLIQMGVGPKNGFKITSKDDTWSSFLESYDKPLLIENVKSYVYIKVKMLFDPPNNSSIIQAFEAQAKELEYRLYTELGGY